MGRFSEDSYNLLAFGWYSFLQIQIKRYQIVHSYPIILEDHEQPPDDPLVHSGWLSRHSYRETDKHIQHCQMGSLLVLWIRPHQTTLEYEQEDRRKNIDKEMKPNTTNNTNRYGLWKALELILPNYLLCNFHVFKITQTVTTGVWDSFEIGQIKCKSNFNKK